MKVAHDIHTHNIFSHCCSDRTASTAAFLQRESELGMKVFGLSNHIWDERVKGCSGWYRPQSIAKAEEAKNAFASAPDGMRVLFGAETEFYAHRNILGMSLDGASHFDYLLIPHSHNHMRNEVMAEYPEAREMRLAIRARIMEAFPEFDEAWAKRMAAVFSEKELMAIAPELSTDIKKYNADAMVNSFNLLFENDEFLRIAARLPVSVAHPFAPCGLANADKNDCLRHISDETFRSCFEKAAKAGVYMELNTGAIMEFGRDLDNNESIRAFALAKAAGCRFTFGSDSHSVKALEGILNGNAIAQKLGLTKDDIAEHVRDGIIE